MIEKERLYKKNKHRGEYFIKWFNQNSKNFIITDDEEGFIEIRHRYERSLFNQFHLSEFYDFSDEKMLDYIHLECIETVNKETCEKEVIEQYREIYEETLKFLRKRREMNIDKILNDK